MTMKMRLKMKYRSHRYKIKRPRPRHGHKCAMRHSIMMVLCIKQQRPKQNLKLNSWKRLATLTRLT